MPLKQVLVVCKSKEVREKSEMINNTKQKKMETTLPIAFAKHDKEKSTK